MKKNLNKIFMIIALISGNTLFCSQSTIKVGGEAGTMVSGGINIDLLKQKSAFNIKTIDTLPELYKTTQEAIRSTVALVFAYTTKPVTANDIEDAIASLPKKNKIRFIIQYITICNSDPDFKENPLQLKEAAADAMYEAQVAQIKFKLIKEYSKKRNETQPDVGCLG